MGGVQRGRVRGGGGGGGARPPPSQQGVWGSAVSSSIGVWGSAPAALQFVLFTEKPFEI